LIKKFCFFSAVIFFQFLVIIALDPDWIQIRIQPKMLDPDPDEMNADPQPSGNPFFYICPINPCQIVLYLSSLFAV
jgi:hypothetical protein